MSGEAILIKGGRVVDSSGSKRADLLIENGRIARCEKGLGAGGARVIEASDRLVMPGLVDMHVHLREPGAERSETIETGCAAAAAGGFTAIVAMPNTDPPIDSVELVRAVRAKSEQLGLCHVEVAGCVSKGRRGEAPSEMLAMAKAGVRLFTDDGASISDAALLKLALANSEEFGFIVADHPEDPALCGEGSGGAKESSMPGEFIRGVIKPGCINEGTLAEKLGLPGRPREAEEAIVARDLAVLASVGGRLHLQHITVSESVDLVKKAKARGLPVTAEATPHHLVFTEEALSDYDPLYKVNPPLRTSADVESLRQALEEGVIDVIATDHAPHAPELKEAPLEEAPAGIASLQVAFSFLYTELVISGILSLEALVGLMSTKPARLLGLEEHGGPIKEGSPANLFVFDPSVAWEFDPARGYSKACATPYAGRKLTGLVTHTVFEGKLVVDEGELV